MNNSMKSQSRSSDLPDLPGTDATNKARRSSKDADAKVEKTLERAANEVEGGKKTRRSLLKQRIQYDGDDSFGQSRNAADEYCSDNTHDLRYALGRFIPNHSASGGPHSRVRQSLTAGLAEIVGSTASKCGGSDDFGINGSNHSVVPPNRNERRASLMADSTDMHNFNGKNVAERYCSIEPRKVANGSSPDVTSSAGSINGAKIHIFNNENALKAKGASRSRQGSHSAINSTNGSMLKLEEKNGSERKRQTSLLKEANNIIHMPQRVLPADLMEKYSSKRNATPETKLSTLEPEKSVPLLEPVVEKVEKIEDVSTIPQVSKATRRWKKAFCFTIVGLRFLNLYEELRAKGMNIQRAKALEAEGLSVLLLAPNISKGDLAVSAKIKELTSKEDRSDEDIEALERILTIKNRAFGRFSLDQRLKFCKIVKYEYYKGERMIVKEGHVSWAFYFILSGQAEIFKVKDNLKYRLNVIGAGTSFGDRTMNMLNDKRTASVASTMDIEMLKIDKTDFFDITNVRDEKGMASRAAKILQVPHFSTAPGGFVERIAPFVQVITYEPNEYILNEGAENNKIFWLLKGTCQCIKMLPFTKKTVNETYSGKNIQVRPFVAGITVLEPGEEFFYEFATTHEVELGQNFVDLPVPTGGSLTEHCFYVNKKNYLEQLKNEDPRDLNSKAAVSIVSKTKVEALCINRVDYANLASNDMLLSIINSKDIYRIPILQLQESYLTTRKWNAYKKKVVSDVVTKNKA